jgi:polyhydroxyalkanoate synthesis regulator phasin
MAEKRDLSDIPYLAVGAFVALEEEIEKAAERLIEKGKSLTPEGRKKMAGAKKGLVSKGDDFSQVVARTVQRALENTGIVTRSDLESIDSRVNHIEKKVATMKKPAAKPAKKPAATKKKASKKPAAKKAAKKAAPKPKPVIELRTEERPPAAAPEPRPVVSDLIPRRPAE